MTRTWPIAASESHLGCYLPRLASIAPRVNVRLTSAMAPYAHGCATMPRYRRLSDMSVLSDQQHPAKRILKHWQDIYCPYLACPVMLALDQNGTAPRERSHDATALAPTLTALQHGLV